MTFSAVFDLSAERRSVMQTPPLEKILSLDTHVAWYEKRRRTTLVNTGNMAILTCKNTRGDSWVSKCVIMYCLNSSSNVVVFGLYFEVKALQSSSKNLSRLSVTAGDGEAGSSIARPRLWVRTYVRINDLAVRMNWSDSLRVGKLPNLRVLAKLNKKHNYFL